MDIIENLTARYPALRPLAAKVKEAGDAIVKAYHTSGKVLTCGSGGSAADSEHIVGELMKQFIVKRDVDGGFRERYKKLFPSDGLCDRLQGAIPAISLVSQTAIMTALINDIGADVIFAQGVYGYGRAGDVLIAMSTSGNSESVLNALKAAKAAGLVTVGFTGAGGGKMAVMGLCDILINVPETETYKIQELHLPVYHAICAYAESVIWG